MEASDTSPPSLPPTCTPTSEALFSLRIVCTEVATVRPQEGLDVTYNSLLGEAVARVPVLRVFGTTPGGQKACVHLHQAFPYFFLALDSASDVQQRDLPRRLAVALTKALVAKRRARNGGAGEERGGEERERGGERDRGRRRGGGGGHGGAYVDERGGGGGGEERGGGGEWAREGQAVHDVRVVHGTPFYGFVGASRYFLKVQLYDSHLLQEAASLLRAGAVLGRSFDVLEAHIPFPLQVFVDLSLSGMGLLHCASLSFRSPLPEHRVTRRGGRGGGEEASGMDDTQAASRRVWLESTVPSAWRNSFRRLTHCAIECDARVQEVLNPHLASQTPLSSHSDTFLVQSLAGVWEMERARCLALSLPPPPPPPALPLRPLVPARPPHEEPKRQLLEQLVRIDRQAAARVEEAERRKRERDGGEETGREAERDGGDVGRSQVLRSQEVRQIAHLYTSSPGYVVASLSPASRSLTSSCVAQTCAVAPQAPGSATKSLHSGEAEQQEREEEEEREAGTEREEAEEEEGDVDMDVVWSQAEDREACGILEWLGEEEERESWQEQEEAEEEEMLAIAQSQEAAEPSLPVSPILVASPPPSLPLSSPHTQPRAKRGRGEEELGEEEEMADKKEESEEEDAFELTNVALPYLSQMSRPRHSLSRSVAQPPPPSPLLVASDGEEETERSQTPTKSPLKRVTFLSSSPLLPDIEDLATGTTLRYTGEDEAVASLPKGISGSTSSPLLQPSLSPDLTSPPISPPGEFAFRYTKRPPVVAVKGGEEEEEGVTYVYEEDFATRYVTSHYSDPSDVPAVARQYAGKALKAAPKPQLPPFLPPLGEGREGRGGVPVAVPSFPGPSVLRPRRPPPTLAEIREEEERKEAEEKKEAEEEKEKEGERGGAGISQHLTTMSVEVVCACRGELLPNPRHDAIVMLAYATHEEDEGSDFVTRVLVVRREEDRRREEESEREKRERKEPVKKEEGSAGGDRGGEKGGGGGGVEEDEEMLLVVSQEVTCVKKEREGEEEEEDLLVTSQAEDLLMEERVKEKQEEEDDEEVMLFISQEEEMERKEKKEGTEEEKEEEEEGRRVFRFVSSGFGVAGATVEWVEDEEELLRRLGEEVRERDPDLVVGYEVQGSSLGYVSERARHLGYEWFSLSRMKRGKERGMRENEWAYANATSLVFQGRVVLNLWRILRSEVTARVYSVQQMADMVLGERVPDFSPVRLSAWYASGGRQTMDAVSHLSRLAAVNIRLMLKQDLVQRTSEMARLYGIEFFAVLSRGSQFRVESMLFRLTKPLNYLLFSPSRSQVRAMEAPECLPLVMEPQSRVYDSPVVVLDFTSLYPSLVIAYNLCYSTCLGRASPSATAAPEAGKRFGSGRIHIPAGLLAELRNEIHVTPNGIMFVREAVRKGVLPRMLQELLHTRAMVKAGMKGAERSGRYATARTLDARQMALKLIANVTYGYTSANFSGRMPLVELADAIVQTGRQTLERAIGTVEKEWKGARVVYGDTDSLFVLLPGASREQAFAVGRAMGKRVTEMNPAPVELKFEKVYLPCALVTKKRYVGYAYEREDQTEPAFDAKGIETVRRDSCPLVARVMEKTLRLLFESKDLSRVKRYVQKEWRAVLEAKLPVTEFVFSKEVRLGSYKPSAPPPPAALVCTKRMAKDPRAEPQYGERVAYVVVHGPPHARLMDLVRCPRELAADSSLRIHGTYYVGKQLLPALSRILVLVGADLKHWLAEMPRSCRLPSRPPPVQGKGRKRTIDAYYSSARCVVCPRTAREGLCETCRADPQLAAFRLTAKLSRGSEKLRRLQELCLHCTGLHDARAFACRSIECPVYHARVKAAQKEEANRGFWPLLRSMASSSEAQVHKSCR